MITLMVMAMWLTTVQAAAVSMNPVKVTMLLTAMSGLTFLILSILLSSTWFPTIFLMLFLGGILMMLMILSSIMPNEKSKKMKMTTGAILLTVMTIMLINPLSEIELSPNMKLFMSNEAPLTSAIVLVTAYFLSFLYILSKSTMPLRSTSCH